MLNVSVTAGDDVDDDERDGLVDDLVERVQALMGSTAQVFTVDREGLAAMARAGDPLLASWSQAR